MYEFLLTVHLLAFALWLGGGVALNIIATRTPPPDRPAVMPQVSFVGANVLTASSIVLVLAGFGLIAEADYDMGDAWIVLGIVIWVASAGIGNGIIAPAQRKAAALAQETPPDVAQLGALRSRILLFSRITLALVVLATIDMVVKPGL